MKTTTTISSTWTPYDTTVAKSHLANYGVIFLDEYDSPIDDIDETDELYENYSDDVVHDVMTLEYIRNEAAREAVTGTEYDTEAVTDWQSLRDLERDILRKRMTESEAREAFRKYFESLIIDMRYFDGVDDDEEDPESLVDKYEKEIREEIRYCYRRVMENRCRTSYSIYIWSDGEIVTLEHVGTPSGWLKPKDWETRKLYYLTSVSESVETAAYVYDGFDESEPEECEEAVDGYLEWIKEFKIDDIMDEIERNLQSEKAE